MQSARLDRHTQAPVAAPSPGKATTASGPNAAQAAAYIHDMSSTLRNLAAQHNLTTLALLLEMAAVEAGSLKAP
jgi:hypothetical protein